MKRKRLTVLLLIVLITTIAFTGCTRKLMWSGNSAGDHIRATYMRFTGTEKKVIRLDEGDTLAIDYQSEVNEGTLTLTITDPEGNEVASLTADTEGMQNIDAPESGKYTLWIMGEKTNGNFRINWSVE